MLWWGSVPVLAVQGRLVPLSPSDDPPRRCFRPDQLGGLPTCTVENGRWERSFASGGDPLGGRDRAADGAGVRHERA